MQRGSQVGSGFLESHFVRFPVTEEMVFLRQVTTSSGAFSSACRFREKKVSSGIAVYQASWLASDLQEEGMKLLDPCFRS
jgi:hypothetical protein